MCSYTRNLNLLRHALHENMGLKNLHAKDLQVIIRAALSQLTRNQRDLILLEFFDEVEPVQIAEHYSLSIPQFEQIRDYTLRKLKKIIRDEFLLFPHDTGDLDLD